MKTVALLFICIVFAQCSGTNSVAVSSDTDYKQAADVFKEFKKVAKKENGKLWNHSLFGPVMLVNQKTRTITANEPDNAGALTRHGDLYVGTLPDNINIANTAFDWNGKRWTMIALPLPDNSADRLNVLLHESFHRIQPLVGFDSLAGMQCAHLDSKEGRILLKLELEALKHALSSSDPDADIANALLFRNYRYSTIKAAKSSENSLEINEGLAEYTGSLLSRTNDADLKRHYISQIDKFFALPSFVRSFPYFTTPVYGYFLRQKDRFWNQKVRKGTNLTDFISGYYAVAAVDLEKNFIMQKGKAYGVDEIVKYEEEREAKKLKQISNYKQKYLGDSLLSIRLEKMSIGFNPSNLIPLDSMGTVFPNLRIVDRWGILQVDSCGALISAAWNKVTVSAPVKIVDTLIFGRGYKLSLSKAYKIESEGKRFRVVKK